MPQVNPRGTPYRRGESDYAQPVGHGGRTGRLKSVRNDSSRRPAQAVDGGSSWLWSTLSSAGTGGDARWSALSPDVEPGARQGRGKTPPPLALALGDGLDAAPVRRRAPSPVPTRWEGRRGGGTTRQGGSA